MRKIAAAVILTLVFAGQAAPAPYHVILCGSGGEEEFQTKFIDWSHRLRLVLATKMGVSQDAIYLLTEGESDGENAYASISLESIAGLFEALAPRLTQEDTLFVYLIGHGSYMKSVSKFHIPGLDLTAADLNAHLNALEAGKIFVLNSTATSAAFINELSKENRIVCTATKSIDEINATEFMGHFVKALEEGSADRNHDDRISVLEACQQAAEMTAAWYSTEGLIATEHAILDDNGDTLGSRLPIAARADNVFDDDTKPGQSVVLFDGKLAERCFIKDFSFPERVPKDIVKTYLSAIDAIEVLKQRKATQDESAYYDELERLLIEAAKANRTIRRYMNEDTVLP